MQLCGSLNILWHCLSLGLEWKLTFSSPVATVEFSKFAGIFINALIYKGSTLKLVDHLPKVSPPNITLSINFQHVDWGRGTNIQSKVTMCLLFFFCVLLPFPSFLSFNWTMFSWFHFLLLACFLVRLLFWVLWDFCFLWFFCNLQCTSITYYNLLSNMSFLYSV